jgi:hypothetical protein
MKTLYLVLASFALLAAEPVLAGSVRVDYTGTIDEMAGDFGSLTGAFEVGTRFSGYFTFDDSVAPTYTDPEQLPDLSVPFYGNPAVAVYEFSSPVWSFHFELGDLSADANVPVEFSPTGGHTIGLFDYELNPTPEYASAIYLGAGVGEPPPNPAIEVLLRAVQLVLTGGEPGLPLHSTNLAAVPWSLIAFPDARLDLQFTESDESSPYALGVIDGLSFSVPEPASAALAALAALALTVLGFARAGAEAPAQADAPSIRML